MRLLSFISLFILLPPAAMPQQAPSDPRLLDRVREQSRLIDDLPQQAWQNPAAHQWQHHHSLSQVASGVQLRDETQAVVTQLGDHDSQWTFDAATHLKHRSSTLWGAAHYDNGSTRGIAWNETSDLDMVYPYVMADSAPLAPLRHERYTFGGGYADHHGRLHWGGEVNYEAGHYYRNVDPRPRNITARLTAKGGAGWMVTERYLATLGVEYVKYKQTNDVAFYSELGKEKLFHLTGLTNDYGRFAGAGDESYYHGHQWTVMLGMIPVDRQGFFATARAERLTIDKVLTSLNKLPMTHITHTAIHTEAAWIHDSWGVCARMDASRRVGREHIFGDPASAVYPQIAALDMFHDNRVNAALEGLWMHSWQQFDLDVKPTMNYGHRNTIYGDPPCRGRINDLTAALTLRGGWRTTGTYSTLTLGAAWTHPIDSELTLTGVKTELNGLQRVLVSDHHFASNNSTAVGARLAVNIALGQRFALQPAVGWCFTAYASDTRAHRINAHVALIF